MRDDLDPRLLRIFAEQILAPERPRVDDFAEKSIILPPAVAARSGALRLTTAQRGVLRALFEEPCRTVVWQASAQSGKTQTLTAAVAYIAAVTPAPTMLVRETAESAGSFMRDALRPVIDASPTLARVFKGANTNTGRRSSDNSKRFFSFPGGYITASSASSPQELSSRPIKYLLLDEVSRWPASAGKEGSPYQLAKARQKTFVDSKTLAVSTPGLAGSCLISSLAKTGDQRRFHLCCEHCQHEFEPTFEHLHWEEGKPETTMLACPECGGLMDEPGRRRALAAGRWISTAEAENPTVVSFISSEIASELSSMESVARAFEAAKDEPSRRAFANTVLAETWDPLKSSTLSEHDLMARMEPVDPQRLPSDVVAVISMSDVQASRLETALLAVTEDKRWIYIEHVVNPGDVGLPHAWAGLASLLRNQYTTADGRRLKLALSGIDCGFASTSVYEFIAQQRRLGQQLIALKGVSGFDRVAVKPLNTRTVGNRARVPAYGVAVDSIKLAVQANLTVEDSTAPGYMTFSDKLDRVVFEQLTAEALVTTFVRGQPRMAWRRVKSSNEAFDCAVGAYAIAQYLLRPNHIAAATVSTAPEPASNIADFATRLNRAINHDRK